LELSPPIAGWPVGPSTPGQDPFEGAFAWLHDGSLLYTFDPHLQPLPWGVLNLFPLFGTGVSQAGDYAVRVRGPLNTVTTPLAMLSISPGATHDPSWNGLRLGDTAATALLAGELVLGPTPIERTIHLEGIFRLTQAKPDPHLLPGIHLLLGAPGAPLDVYVPFNNDGSLLSTTPPGATPEAQVQLVPDPNDPELLTLGFTIDVNSFDLPGSLPAPGSATSVRLESLMGLLGQFGRMNEDWSVGTDAAGNPRYAYP